MKLAEGMPTLVDELLAEQGSLSAVERFSQQHEQISDRSEHSLYQDLIPLSKPGPAEQYSFEVDLDVCSGCKACVAACHSMNGLAPDESWRDVGSLVSLEGEAPVNVTSACHHCLDPACADGCPTLAYEKDPETGVVYHLDDQCIGCSYCELKCPYDVPKFHNEKGIVRKCDMCRGRLAEGEAPACVAACPNGAIRIKLVSTEEVSRSGQLLPGTFDSSYTVPTTTFLSSRDLQGRQHADSEDLPQKKGRSHFPLVVMLVLVQLAVGAGIAAALQGSRSLAILAFLVGQAGLGASIFHLGQPKKAWRAFLGLRRSWLSREIVAFGLWSPFALAAAFFPEQVLLWASVAVGVLATACSAMVYIDTRRPSWAARPTLLRFFGVVLLATLAGLLWPPLLLPLGVLALFERRQFFHSMSIAKMPGN